MYQCCNLFRKFWIVFQHGLCGIAPLCELCSAIAEPASTLLNDVVFYTQVEYFAHFRDAFAEENVEFYLTERRRNLVFCNLYTHMIAYDIVAVLDGSYATNVQTHGAVELQSVATRCCFGVSEHHANLFAQLIDEDTASVCLADGRCQLAQSLAHEARLQANV